MLQREGVPPLGRSQLVVRVQAQLAIVGLEGGEVGLHPQQAGKKGQPATTASTANTPPAATDPSPPPAGKDKSIRSVGPTFIPNNNTTTR